MYVGSMIKEPCSSPNGLLWSVTVDGGRVSKSFFNSEALNVPLFMEPVEFLLNMFPFSGSSTGPTFFFKVAENIDLLELVLGRVNETDCSAAITSSSGSAGMSIGERKLSANILLERFVLH